MNDLQKYIKMCVGAKDDLWSPEYSFRFGSLFAYATESRIAFSINWSGTWSNAESQVVPIWQQDQLQEMISTPSESLASHNLHWKFHKWFANHRFDLEEYEWLSMEQLWLAFVMYEKYNKAWSDGEWLTW